MKTEVLLRRKFLNGKIRQSNQTGFLNVNDLLLYGNQWRIMNHMKTFDYNSWYNSSSTKEFLKEMETHFGKVIISKKGKTGSRFVHPFVFIDIALSISPELKIEVYSWIYDELVKYRNNSGDSYKKMCGALYIYCKNKSKFSEGITKTAKMIKSAVGISDWQTANEEQLRLRDRIHENIALLSDIFRDNNQAIRIGILKALKK